MLGQASRKTDPMTLGSDVSNLTTNAASAALQGLSIVIPLYNEAAGLELLHQRLSALGTRLRQRFRLPAEVVYVDGQVVFDRAHVGAPWSDFEVGVRAAPPGPGATKKGSP